MTDSVDNKAKTVSELGEDVQIYRPDWDSIVTGSIKLSLRIAYWRAQTSLSRADLGLDGADDDFAKFLSENISLGTKRLLPKKRFQQLRRLERQAREKVIRLGHPLDLERGAYLVGKKVYLEEIRPYLVERRKEFMAARDAIVTQRDEIVAEMKESYIRAAVAAYKIRSGLPLNQPAKVPADFIDSFVKQVIDRIPSAEDIEQSFEFTWKPAYVESPEELETAKAKAAEIRRKQEILETAAQAEREKIWAETGAEQEKQRLELEEHRRALAEQAALDREIREQQAHDLQKQMAETTGLVVGNIRSILYESVVAALESYRKNGELVNRTVTGLGNLAERLTALNQVVGDTDVAQYAEIVAELGTRQGEQRSAVDIEDKLTQLAVAARGEMLSLGLKPRTAHHLSIPDKIEGRRVRQARLALGVTEKIEAPALQVEGRRVRRGDTESVQLSL